MKGRKDNWNSERTFHGRLDVKQKMRLELYLRKSKMKHLAVSMKSMLSVSVLGMQSHAIIKKLHFALQTNYSTSMFF